MKSSPHNALDDFDQPVRPSRIAMKGSGVVSTSATTADTVAAAVKSEPSTGRKHQPVSLAEEGTDDEDIESPLINDFLSGGGSMPSSSSAGNKDDDIFWARGLERHLIEKTAARGFCARDLADGALSSLSRICIRELQTAISFSSLFVTFQQNSENRSSDDESTNGAGSSSNNSSNSTNLENCHRSLADMRLPVSMSHPFVLAGLSEEFLMACVDQCCRQNNMQHGAGVLLAYITCLRALARRYSSLLDCLDVDSPFDSPFDCRTQDQAHGGEADHHDGHMAALSILLLQQLRLNDASPFPVPDVLLLRVLLTLTAAPLALELGLGLGPGTANESASPSQPPSSSSSSSSQSDVERDLSSDLACAASLILSEAVAGVLGSLPSTVSNTFAQSPQLHDPKRTDGNGNVDTGSGSGSGSNRNNSSSSRSALGAQPLDRNRTMYLTCAACRLQQVLQLLDMAATGRLTTMYSQLLHAEDEDEHDAGEKERRARVSGVRTQAPRTSPTKRSWQLPSHDVDATDDDDSVAAEAASVRESYRLLSRRMELLASGTLRSIVPLLAVTIRLAVYHSSDGAREDVQLCLLKNPIKVDYNECEDSAGGVGADSPALTLVSPPWVAQISTLRPSEAAAHDAGYRYFFSLCRADAVSVLTGLREGSFLVRPHDKQKDLYFLSFVGCGDEGVKHAIIRKESREIRDRETYSTPSKQSGWRDSPGAANGSPLLEYEYRCGKVGPCGTLGDLLSSIALVLPSGLVQQPISVPLHLLAKHDAMHDDLFHGPSNTAGFLEPKYSCDPNRDFWSAVNSLKDCAGSPRSCIAGGWAKLTIATSRLERCSSAGDEAMDDDALALDLGLDSHDALPSLWKRVPSTIGLADAVDESLSNDDEPEPVVLLSTMVDPVPRFSRSQQESLLQSILSTLSLKKLMLQIHAITADLVALMQRDVEAPLFISVRLPHRIKFSSLADDYAFKMQSQVFEMQRDRLLRDMRHRLLRWGSMGLSSPALASSQDPARFLFQQFGLGLSQLSRSCAVHFPLPVTAFYALSSSSSSSPSPSSHWTEDRTESHLRGAFSSAMPSTPSSGLGTLTTSSANQGGAFQELQRKINDIEALWEAPHASLLTSTLLNLLHVGVVRAETAVSHRLTAATPNSPTPNSSTGLLSLSLCPPGAMVSEHVLHYLQARGANSSGAPAGVLTKLLKLPGKGCGNGSDYLAECLDPQEAMQWLGAKELALDAALEARAKQHIADQQRSTPEEAASPGLPKLAAPASVLAVARLKEAVSKRQRKLYSRLPTWGPDEWVTAYASWLQECRLLFAVTKPPETAFTGPSTHYRYRDAWEVRVLSDMAAVNDRVRLGRYFYGSAAPTSTSASASASASGSAGNAGRASGAESSALLRCFDAPHTCASERLSLSQSAFQREAVAKLAHAKVLWESLRAEAWLVMTIGNILPQEEREAGGGNVPNQLDPYRATLTRSLFRNSIYSRVGLPHRIVCVVQVDLFGIKEVGNKEFVPASTMEVYACVRLLKEDGRRAGALGHAGSAGSGIAGKDKKKHDSSSLGSYSHRVQPDGSCITAPRKAEHVKSATRGGGGGSSASGFSTSGGGQGGNVCEFQWRDQAVLRFALPEGLVGLGTGSNTDMRIQEPWTAELLRPPCRLHITIFERTFFSDAKLGEVDMPLDAVTEERPFRAWLPLTSERERGGAWFIHAQVQLKLMLMAIEPPPSLAVPPSIPTSISASSSPRTKDKGSASFSLLQSSHQKPKVAKGSSSLMAQLEDFF